MTALVLPGTLLAVQSGALLDQRSTQVEGSAPVTPTFEVAQTFTAGRTGTLTDIVVALSQPGGATLPLHLALTAVDGLGLHFPPSSWLRSR